MHKEHTTELASAPLLVSEPEARVILGGISVKTLFNYRRAGQLPFVRIGTRVFYRLEDLQQFVAQRRQGGTR